MKVKKTKLIKTLEKVCLDIYDELGGLNFDEKDFQVALGYELSSLGIEYLRETHIELYYKDIPVKLGAPDFYLNKEKPATIIEIKLSSGLDNSNRQQLKMYLLSIRRNPKSVRKHVKNGLLINFLKNNPQTFVNGDASAKKKQQYKVEIEQFTLDKEDNLKLLGSSSIGEV